MLVGLSPSGSAFNAAIPKIGGGIGKTGVDSRWRRDHISQGFMVRHLTHAPTSMKEGWRTHEAQYLKTTGGWDAAHNSRSVMKIVLTEELLKEYIRAKLKMHTNIDDEESPESVRWFGKLIEQGYELLFEYPDGDEKLDEDEAIIN